MPDGENITVTLTNPEGFAISPSDRTVAVNVEFTIGAAQLCDDYVNEESGTGVYYDWYLPSRDELFKLYLSKDKIGGFSSLDYWSSSEDGYLDAWFRGFYDGYNQCSSPGKEESGT
ncbi:MAG: hypothetical protein JEY91_04020 [Spirochaetaceae bacterium]|nr:hypothetical protein [Spirochaetaceae bacterium]